MKRRSSWVDWLRRRCGNAACILVYHRISELPSDPWQLCVSPHHFQEQMQLLREMCYPVSLSSLPALLHGRRRRQLPVAVTFDDGYADNLHHALPVLQQYEIPATFFLISNSVGEQREFWWDELDRILLQPGSLPARLELTVRDESDSWDLGNTVEYSAEQADAHRPWRAWQPPPTPRQTVYCSLWKRLYSMAPEPRRVAVDTILRWAGIEPAPRLTHRALTRAEVATLSGHQLVEIGAHTANHRALGDLAAADQQREIDCGKNALQEMLARSVMSFAYPHGDYTEETVDFVRRAGFQRACTTRPGLVRRGDDLFQLPRNCIGDVGGDATARSLSQWQRSCV